MGSARGTNPAVVESIALLLGVAERSVVDALEQCDHYRVFRTSRGRRVELPPDALSELQRAAHRRLLRKGGAHPAAWGGVAGRSFVDAAKRHLARARELLRVDVRAAWHSVTQRAVYEALACPLRPELQTLDLSRGDRDAVVHALAKLLTAPLEKGRGRHLALGSPSSAALFNWVMAAVDDAISQRLADYERTGGGPFVHTRWIDDIVISSPGPLPESLLREVTVALGKAGFRVQHEKTQRLAAPDLEVHGLVARAGGVALSDAEAARTARRITQLVEGLEGTDADVADECCAQLRGLDAFLSQVSGEGQRPAELTIDRTLLRRRDTGQRSRAAPELSDLWSRGRA